MSFSLLKKHIEIIGLLDTGNALYDTKTGRPVMIISLSVIKKLLPKDFCQKIERDDFTDEIIINKLDCVTVGGKKKIPIIDIGEVNIESIEKGEVKKMKCVLGITKEKFAESDDYECLLHREFL